MAQIRSKQIADFLSTVNWAAVKSTEIPNTADVKTYVDQEVEALGLNANASIDSLESALAAEILATNGDVTTLIAADSTEKLRAETAEGVLQGNIDSEAATRLANDNTLQGNIDAEKSRAEGKELSLETAISVEEDRIDAILLASDADKDSFAEIVSLINAVDTENDSDVATVISNLNAEIASTNSDVTRIDAAAGSLETAMDSADSTEKARAMAAEGSLETKFDGEVSRLDDELAAEISSTNSDVIALGGEIAAEATRAGLAEGSLETKFDGEVSRLDGELAAEIAATNSDVTRIDAAMAAEIAATNSEVVRLDGLNSTLSTEVVDEVASIDLRLGEVSGDLVDSVDSLEVALSAEIVATDADFTSLEAVVSGADSTEKARAIAAELSLTTRLGLEEAALTAEIAATNADFTSVNTRAGVIEGDVVSIDARVLAEEGRVDAILLASDADKDSFKEIVSLINAVDTVNDDALAVVISDLNAEISATNADVTALEGADSTEKLRAETAEGVLDGKITAEAATARAAELLNANNLSDYETSNDAALSEEVSNRIADVNAEEARAIAAEGVNAAAIVTEKDRAEAAELVLTNAIATEKTRAEGIEAGHNGRLETLEAAIIEDEQMFVETFVGAGFVYDMANPVQEDQVALVSAFVNGHKVEVSAVAGTNVTLANPGYVIDAEDVVVFTYQA